MCIILIVLCMFNFLQSTEHSTRFLSLTPRYADQDDSLSPLASPTDTSKIRSLEQEVAMLKKSRDLQKRIYSYRIELLRSVQESLQDRTLLLQQQIAETATDIERKDRVIKNLKKSLATAQQQTQDLDKERKKLAVIRTNLAAISVFLLRKLLTPPTYATECERKNLQLEHSCGICHDLLSKIPPTDRTTSKKMISIVVGCKHIFCQDCYRNWQQSRYYHNNCPMCRQTDEPIYTFKVPFDQQTPASSS